MLSMLQVFRGECLPAAIVSLLFTPIKDDLKICDIYQTVMPTCQNLQKHLDKQS